MIKTKQRFMRALSLFVIPVGIVLVLATPASAVSTVAIDDEGTLKTGGVRVEVPVTIACDSGQTAFLDLTLTQRSGGQIASGTAFSNFTCTGSTQTFNMSVRTFTNKAFKKGKADAQANLTACNSTFTCTTITDIKEIKLVK